MNSIGKYTYSPTQLLLHYQDQANLTVGKYCSFGHNVNIFLGGNHRIDWVTTFPLHQLPFINKQNNGHPETNGDITIGNDVWIGLGTTIMSGVTIGDGAVIGACSVVTKDVAPYWIVAGNPARYIRDRFTPYIVKSLLEIKWWDWDEKKILENVDLLQSENIQRFVKLFG